MSHPYDSLSKEAYWRTGVAEVGPHGLRGLWTPKFQVLQEHRIVTAGSCFAQHIGKALLYRGYGWADFEPAPPFLKPEDAARYNYGIFSFRTGNIYTPAMLLQWFRMAFGVMEQPTEVWEADGRFYDPLRPAIEPNGFESAEEVFASRDITLTAIKEAVTGSDIFVFTLGLTERWVNPKAGVTYAMAPGTLAGVFDPARHEFVNDNARMSFRNLRAAIQLAQKQNPELRFLLTVSPVPLTATATGQHVLTATSYSKSVLRAAAGMAADELPAVDYFPSYEIITHPVFRGIFYAPNMRSVEPQGVATVMQHFFADQERTFGPQKPTIQEPVAKTRRDTRHASEDVRCEEEMLDAFSR